MLPDNSGSLNVRAWCLLALFLCPSAALLLAFPHPAEAAFPVVKATNTSVDEDGNTSHVVSLPAGIQSGDVLIIIISLGDPDTPVGWNEIFTPVFDSESSLAAFYRVANGSEGSTVTVTHEAGFSSVHNSYRISGASSVEGTSAVGDGDPPNLAPSWGKRDTLWLAAFSGWDDGGADEVEGAPTNYTNLLTAENSLPYFVASARRELNAASEQPGEFTEDVLFNATATLAIKPGPAVLLKPPNNLGLVGYWSFNEGTSTQATDFSGNGNTGTLDTESGSVPTWANGKRGRALDFSDGVVAAGSGASIDDIFLGSGGTLVAWINPRSAGESNNGRIADKGENDGDGWTFYFPSASRVLNLNWAAGGGSTFGSWVTTDTVPLNQWTQVAVTYDGTNSNNDPIIYINGVAVSIVEEIVTSAMGSDAAATFVVGARSNGCCGFARYFDGRIDEMRAYKRILSASEIASLAKSGAVKFTTSSVNLQQGSSLANGLVGHWTFDNLDSQTTITDRSGQNNHGYFVGGATSSAKTAGKLGQALRFDGNNDSVVTTTGGTLDLPGAMSACAWIYARSVPNSSEAIIISNAASGSFIQYSFEIENDRSVALFWNDTGTFPHLITDPAAITFNTWYHACAVRVSSSAGTLYINGAAQNTNIDSQPISTVPGPTTIGGPSSFWDGYLDDVRLYNRTLSPAEIQQLYKLGTVVIRP